MGDGYIGCESYDDTYSSIIVSLRGTCYGIGFCLCRLILSLPGE